MGVLVQGFGVNDLRGTEYEKEIYTKWASMLNRCYSEKYHKIQPTYVGCPVHEDWRLFSKFRYWALQQDWEGKELDKDLLVTGNKVYSSETCCFIPCYVNCFLTESAAVRGNYPIGVCWDGRSRKYRSRVSNPLNKHREHLGFFECPKDAYRAWLARKLEIAYEIAATEPDQRIADAIVNRYKTYGETDGHSI